MQDGTWYLILLLLASVMNVFLIGYAYYYRRRKSGVTAYVALVIAITFYTFGYLMEILSGSLAGVLFWLRVEYLGVSFFAALWLVMVLQYTGYDRWLTKPALVAVFIVPVITLGLHYTNAAHHLFYRDVSVVQQGQFSIAQLTKGVWYWVHISNLYLALLLGNVLLATLLRGAAGRQQRQTLSIMIGSLLPLVGNLLYLLGLSPQGMDFGPVMIAFSTPLYAWSLFNLRLFDLVPIARDRVVDGLRDGVLVLDEEGRVADFNPAARAIVPGLTQEAVGRPLTELPLPLEFASKIAWQQSEFDFAVGEGDGRRYYRARFSPIYSRGRRSIGQTIILMDVTERLRLLAQLQRLAHIDELTQVYNRRYFIQAAQKLLQSAQPAERLCAVVLFDLDYFKQVNDTYGHAAGDLALKTVAERCRQELPATVIFGRYGGEEFSVCWLPESEAEAIALAEKLRLLIGSAVIYFEQQNIAISASFGVAIDTAGDGDLEIMLREADRALYQAKENGRNCVCVAAA